MITHVLSMSVGALSLLITVLGKWLAPEIGGIIAGIAGMSYGLLGLVHWLHGRRTAKLVDDVAQRLSLADPAPSEEM